MKLLPLLVGVSLSGCALAGWEGPAQQQRAKAGLHQLPGLLAQVPQAGLNDLETLVQALDSGGGGYTSDSSQELYGRAARQADWDNFALQQKLDNLARQEQDHFDHIKQNQRWRDLGIRPVF